MPLLKDSNIFDLTDDATIIATVLGYETTREEYLATVYEANIPIDMLALAEETNNQELAREIKETFGDSLSTFFNE